MHQQEKKENQQRINQHIAWKTFSVNWKAAPDNQSAREVFSTLQFLDKLNRIAVDEYYTETMLYQFLNENGFKTATLEDSATSFWMIMPA